MTVGTTLQRRSYAIHGIGVEVRADNPAIIEAMELRLGDFRSDAGGEPDVRFEFAAEARDGHEAPPPSDGRPVYDVPHGSLYYSPDSDVLWGEFGRVRLRCEPAGGVARLSSPEFSARELYLATHPLATISLMELLERRGLFSLHAACLANGDARGVLLAGPSGSGKSTLSLALARSGMRFVSDDIVFLAQDVGSSAVRALGFADAIGVSDHAAARFGDLLARLGPPADGFPKRLARIEVLLGTAALGSCEPSALVFPDVVPGEPSAIAPLDPRDALLRLVPDVLLTHPVATQAHLGAIASLLDQVRCYALRSGADLERAGDLVRALM